MRPLWLESNRDRAVWRRHRCFQGPVAAALDGPFVVLFEQDSRSGLSRRHSETQDGLIPKASPFDGPLPVRLANSSGLSTRAQAMMRQPDEGRDEWREFSGRPETSDRIIALRYCRNPTNAHEVEAVFPASIARRGFQRRAESLHG